MGEIEWIFEGNMLERMSQLLLYSIAMVIRFIQVQVECVQEIIQDLVGII